MSISKGLSGRSGDSLSHHSCLVVDENVAYHLTHNAKSRKRCDHQDLTMVGTSHWTVLPLDYKPNRYINLVTQWLVLPANGLVVQW
jgi:hypothetical protein